MSMKPDGPSWPGVPRPMASAVSASSSVAGGASAGAGSGAPSASTGVEIRILVAGIQLPVQSRAECPRFVTIVPGSEFHLQIVNTNVDRKYGLSLHGLSRGSGEEGQGAGSHARV